MPEIDINKSHYPQFDGEQLGFIFGMIRGRMLRPGMTKAQRFVAESILEEIRRMWGSDAPRIEQALAELAKTLGVETI